MPARSKVLRNRTIRGKEALRVPARAGKGDSVASDPLVMATASRGCALVLTPTGSPHIPDFASSIFGGLAPADVAGAEVPAMASRQEDIVLLAVLQHPVA